MLNIIISFFFRNVVPELLLFGISNQLLFGKGFNQYSVGSLFHSVGESLKGYVPMKMGSLFDYSHFNVILIFLVTSWWIVNTAVHFVRFHDLDGLVCPSDDRVVACPADSQMICATLCKVDAACKSFFFDENIGRCYGCNKVYPTTKHLWQKESTLYFFDEDQAVALGERVEGLIFVFMSGKWGTVCDDGWINELQGYRQNNLNVVCRSLGFNSGQILGKGTYNLSNSDGVAIWMDDVKCTGSETSLLTCPFNGLGKHNCGHDEDVSVSCYDL